MDCLLLSWVLCTLNLYWNFKIFSHCHLLLIIFLDRRQRGPIGSVLLVIIGWLVGNTETALRIFLISCMKLGDYEGRKVAEPDFWKKFLIWRYSRKDLKIIQKSDTDIFLKNGSSDFLVFGLKLVLNMTFKKMCNLEIFDLEIVKKELPKLRFLAIFSTLHH